MKPEPFYVTFWRAMDDFRQHMEDLLDVFEKRRAFAEQWLLIGHFKEWLRFNHRYIDLHKLTGYKVTSGRLVLYFNNGSYLKGPLL